MLGKVIMPPLSSLHLQGRFDKRSAIVWKLEAKPDKIRIQSYVETESNIDLVQNFINTVKVPLHTILCLLGGPVLQQSKFSKAHSTSVLLSVISGIASQQ